MGQWDGVLLGHIGSIPHNVVPSLEHDEIQPHLIIQTL